MPIAGALVVPVNPEEESVLKLKLATVPGIGVKEEGPRGIAIVLEAKSTGELKKISQDIEKWDNVLDI